MCSLQLDVHIAYSSLNLIQTLALVYCNVSLHVFFAGQAPAFRVFCFMFACGFATGCGGGGVGGGAGRIHVPHAEVLPMFQTLVLVFWSMSLHALFAGKARSMLSRFVSGEPGQDVLNALRFACLGPWSEFV